MMHSAKFFVDACFFVVVLQVPKRYFKILLGYMKGLQGNQRQATMAKAQAIVDRYRIEDSNSPSPDANVSRRIYKRAFAILKVLAQ